MYKTSELKTMLLFDIETLPEKWEKISKEKKNLWLQKHHYKCYQQEVEFRQKQFFISNDDPAGNLKNESSSITPSFQFSFKEIYTKYAGLYPEFARVWCISFGLFDLKNNITINTLQNDDEKQMLEDFNKVLEHYKAYNLTGHNIEEFDIPFIINRLQILGLNKTFPRQLQLKNAKPWTTTHIDFQKDWKGLRWAASSLDLVCAALGVASPKAKFENHEFTTLMTDGKITVDEGIEYCEGDVRALGECILKCSSDECNYAIEETKKTWSKK